MTAPRGYRISELLGSGSFGRVYLADALGGNIERRVAIKVLKREQAAIPGVLQRLRDEARMLALIRHRAIVRVDDLIELDGHWSVIMEYVEGCDLAEILGEGPLPPRVALGVAEEIANALHAAATQKGPDGRPLRLVHRDVKPSNVRVTAQGEVKLLDFGVARAEFDKREAGGTSVVFGTPTYMAPERFRGEDTHAGDVYALGVTLFEMLVGEPPGLTPMEADRIPPGTKLAPQWRWLYDTSPPLRDLVAGMMAPNPDERPPARDCSRALGRIRSNLGGMHLEDWAERVVPMARKVRKPRPDDRTGSVLREGGSQGTLRVSGPLPATSALLAGGAMATIAAVVGGVVLALGVGAWWFGREPAVQPPVVGVVEAPAVVSPAVVSPAVVAPAVVAPAVVAPPVVAPPVVTPPVAAPPVAPPVAAPPVAAPPAPRPPVAPPIAPPVTRPPARPVAEEPPPARPPEVPARAPPATGIVGLDGDAVSVILTGRNGVFPAGEIPAGTYSAEVTVTDGETIRINLVTVKASRVTRIQCAGQACTEIGER